MKKYIVTIARGFGSGGSHIGKMLSEKLHIPFYDDEIIQMASDRSGIESKYFFEANRKLKDGKVAILTSRGAYTGNLYGKGDNKFLSNENLFNYQAAVLHDLVKNTSCIIAGKAANYVLKDFSNVLSVNIQAPLEYCVINVEERLKLMEEEAENQILEINKYRRDYYAYYTGREWSDPTEYDLCINTASMGEENAADLIIHYLKTCIIKK